MNMMHSQSIDIKFTDLTYKVKVGYRGPKKAILKGLNGFFRTTELTAIMGPSGAGKSTLLNILSGFLPTSKYTGMVEYQENGDKNSNNNNDNKRMKKHLCYIQQTDNLHGFLNVHEIMTIASYLKISRSVSQKSRYMLIDEILKMLNLSLAKNTRVSQLSGGQRKRLSIALELIDNPPIMFLDEPTTGLDSLASIQCISTLKTLAKRGRTIICTIHQPSAMIYEMFDHIYLVVDGYCLYRSSPGNTIGYFTQQGFQCPQYYNPADYMLELVTGEYGDHMEKLTETATWIGKVKDEARIVEASRRIVPRLDFSQTTVQPRPPSELTRFWILLWRLIIATHRDHTILHVQMVFHFLVAILLGLLFQHTGDDGNKTVSNISFLMCSVLYMHYITMMPGVLKFPMEINILKKERFNNWYQLRTYYVALIVYMIPLLILFASIYSTVTYLMTNQPYDYSRFFMYLLIITLTTLVGEVMGLGLGAVFTPITGTFVGSIITCVMLSLAGFLIFLKHMPTYFYYASYLNLLQYEFNGLMQAIYGNHREKLYCPDIYCHYNAPDMILQELDMEKPMFWIDVIVILGHFVGYLIIAYILLKRRLSKLH